LVLDESAIALAVSKLDGAPVFAGPGGDLLAPGVIDLVNDESIGERWQPGDERTRLLVLGAEACSEVIFCAERLAGPPMQRRAMKGMVVPVCSLMDVVDALLKSLNDERSRLRRRDWSAEDETYVGVARRLRKLRLNGPVRRARNRLGAHLDPDAFDEPALLPGMSELLGALGDALVPLMLAFNHGSQAFAWIRGIAQTVGDGFHVVETMFEYPLCVRWITDEVGRVKDVGLLRLASDPRGPLREEVTKAVAVYNRLATASACGASTIWMRPREESTRS
jgi:hypothetical protein